MSDMVFARLQAWCTNPKNCISDPMSSGNLKPRAPTQIIFYRDGIGETQFEEAREKEVVAVRNAFARIASQYESSATLKLTFIVAGKRHHTRFYPTNPKACQSNANGNVTPGLFVDEVVTTPGSYNFYLQSHAAIKGTARSAHYHLLEADVNWDDGSRRFAELTHALCYCFGRATKGVSYVAPAYIADRLCERGRVYLKNWTPSRDYQLQPRTDRQRWTKDLIADWKKTKARDVARTAAAWGANFNDGSDAARPVRLDPWHSNLDGTMFWM
jgi:eukaryotic translation initiation factor 2C